VTPLHGVVVNHTPYVLGNVLKRGVLRLETTPAPPRAKRIFIAVDTGFTGCFSLPEETLAHLKLDFLGYEGYVLANRQKVDVPPFSGRVVAGTAAYETRFIPGQGLMGVEFMSTLFGRLEVDFRAGSLTLK
jgi:predicted aspartyl protease